MTVPRRDVVHTPYLNRCERVQRTAMDDQRYVRQVARLASGMVLAAGRYLVHRVPLYRRDRQDLPEPPVPDPDRDLPGDRATLQRASQGVGPLYHRCYQIAFTDEDRGPSQLIAALRRDPNAASPVEFARFERVNGGANGPLRVGDELLLRLRGPWDGPVRVVDLAPTSFRFATLDGHMEAGEIEFRAGRNDRGWCVFTIESWARSGDQLFSLIYHRLPFARELQLHMWAHFCNRVARIAGGVVMTNVELHTCTPDLDEVHE